MIERIENKETRESLSVLKICFLGGGGGMGVREKGCCVLSSG
jgi:hypothetical protein